MGVLALGTVGDDTVHNGVQHDQQANGLQIFAQVLNVKA